MTKSKRTGLREPFATSDVIITQMDGNDSMADSRAGLSVTEAANRFYGTLYRFVYRMMQHHQTAEDLTQEAFLRLSANDRCLDDGATRRWLFTVARNLCMGQFRRSAVRMRLDPHVAKQAREAVSPSQRAAAAELGERVALLVGELEPEFREVLVLRAYEGLSYAEIAAILGCAEGTVKSRLARARERLRAGLNAYWESER